MPDAVQTSNESPSTIFIGEGRGSIVVKPADDGEDQFSAEERAAQYEGIPGVNAKPQHITSAIGIAVCPLRVRWKPIDVFQVLLASADQTVMIACYGKIGSNLKTPNDISRISTG